MPPKKEKKVKLKATVTVSVEDALAVKITNVAKDATADGAADTATASTATSNAGPVKNDKGQEHVVVQLSIPSAHIDQIIGSDYSDKNGVPQPSNNTDRSYASVPQQTADQDVHQRIACFWCCHPIPVAPIGLPIAYDSVHDNFMTFGSFCSLECASAYNFEKHQGSDRVWEINTWIQLLGRRMGLINVRPAPSRFILKMFGGSLTIDEFRAAHSDNSRTYLLNIPPLVTVNTQIECLNTSCLSGQNILDIERCQEKTKLSRIKSVVDTKRTLEGKMNLTLA